MTACRNWALDVTVSRASSSTLAESLVREEEEHTIASAVSGWTTFAEARQHQWTTKTAAELTEEAFDSFRAPAAKVVWILVKSVELGTVVFE